MGKRNEEMGKSGTARQNGTPGVTDRQSYAKMNSKAEALTRRLESFEPNKGADVSYNSSFEGVDSCWSQNNSYYHSSYLHPHNSSHHTSSNKHYRDSKASLHTPPPRQPVRQPHSSTGTQQEQPTVSPSTTYMNHDNDSDCEYDVDAYEHAQQQQLVNSNHSDDEYDIDDYDEDEYEYHQLQLHSHKPPKSTDNNHETNTPNSFDIEPFEGCDLSPIQILTPTTLHTPPPPQQQQNTENDTDYTILI